MILIKKTKSDHLIQPESFKRGDRLGLIVKHFTGSFRVMADVFKTLFCHLRSVQNSLETTVWFKICFFSDLIADHLLKADSVFNDWIGGFKPKTVIRAV